MLRQVVQRVFGHAVVPHLKVAVVAGGVAGGAGPGHLLALVNVLSHVDGETGVVTVPGDIAVAVLGLHQITVAAHPAGVGHGAAIGGVDGCPSGDGDVDALVVGGTDAAGGFPSAEVGADPTAGGPAAVSYTHLTLPTTERV